MTKKITRMEFLSSFNKDDLTNAIYKEWQRVSISTTGNLSKRAKLNLANNRDRLDTLNRVFAVATISRNRRIL